MDDMIKKLQAWLAIEHHSEKSVSDGALLLFSLNKNRILYQTILRKPARYEAKVRYELSKHLRILLAGLTMADIRRMLPSVEKAAKETIDAGIPESGTGDSESAAEDSGSADKDPESASEARPSTRGRRADHDSLPAEIRELWVKNGQRWQVIRQAYNTLQELIRSDAKPCDLFDTLELLRTTDESYRADMARYDEAKAETSSEES